MSSRLSLLALVSLLALPSTNGLAGDAPFAAQHVVALSADEPRSIVVGDLDSDGDLDLVSASASIADGKLAWYRNLGAGEFEVEQPIASGSAFAAVLAFDADGDGDLDLLAGIDGPEKPRWYENIDGAGTFELGQLIEVASDHTAVLATADVDRDGDTDVLGASFAPPLEIVAYTNSGDGTFSESLLVGSVGASVTTLLPIDLDRDGDLDVVSGGDEIAGVGTGLAWWENVGGAWSLRGIGSTDTIEALRTADLDRDGDIDVIVGGGGAVAWFENIPDPGPAFLLVPHPIEDDEQSFSSIRAADLDDDGDADVLAASDGGIRWFENTDGTGGFAPGKVISTNVEGTTALDVADLDRDGDLDVLSASTDDDKLAVYRNRRIHRSALFFSEEAIDPFLQASAVAAADLDLDGTQDLICTDLWEPSIFWSPNLDGFETRIDFSFIDDVRSLDVADFDRDGLPDVVSGAYFDGRLAWHSNGEDGPGEGLTISGPSFEAYRSARAADMDGDGDPDVVTGSDILTGYLESTGTANVAWWENDGTPGDFPDWQVHSVGNSGDSARSVAPVDLDRDGDLDVVVGSTEGAGGELVWFRNDGAFTREPIAEGIDGVYSVATGDLDGDGDPDVVAARDTTISWHANELPLASWPESLIAAVVEDGRLVATADLDNDGDLDVLSGSGPTWDGQLVWYENQDGAGTFGEEQVLATFPSQPTGVARTDLDRDGDLDIVGASIGDGKSVGQLAIYDNSGGQYHLGTENLAPPTSFDGQLVPLLAISMAVNARPGDSVAKLATLALGFDTGLAPEGVPFDLTTLFNADVIVNDGNNGLDLIQESIDSGSNPSGNFAFVTQSAAGSLCSFDPDGVPDDGFFPANAFHPDVHLDYDNAQDGFNAHRSWYAVDSFSIPVPADRYTQVHLFATTGDGNSDFTVTLLYDDASWDETSLNVPDWFDDPPPGAYALVDGLDRVNPGAGPGVIFGCEDNNTAAIFGFPIPADPYKTLVGLEVERVDADGVANFFGAIGLRAEDVFLDSIEANALIDELRLYRDDGSGQFEQGSDALVRTFEPLDLDAGGRQTLVLSEDDPDLVVALPATFLLVAELTENASAETPNGFRLTHLAGTSTARNAESDVDLLAEPPLDLEYSFVSTRTVVQPAYRVDSSDDGTDNAPGDEACGTLSATCTLRAAIQEANARAGDDLILVPAALAPYLLTEAGAFEDAGADGDLDIANNGTLTIRGEGSVRPLIDADGLDRVFDVQDGATLVLEGLTLTGGVAPTEGGGAIRAGANAALTLEHCEITGNTALDGGGILGGLNAGIEIVDSTIANNTATSAGGGISILTALTLRGSTIAENVAYAGGALHTSLGVWTVSNTTVSGNQTTGPASAAIDGGGPGSKCVSTTVTANTGGGIAGTGASIGNSIVAANGIDLSGAFTSFGYNLIGDPGSASGFVDGVAGDQVGGGGTPLVALVAPLSANGGETLTHRLLPGSPAVDAGRCPDLSVDQRGEARRVDIPSVDDASGSDACDIGAYESGIASVLLPLEIPIRWCAVAGAPSATNPSLVGAGTLDDVLRQRLDRATENILEPRAAIVLRSGATEIVESFPVLADPLAIGQPGDVFVEPETADFDEFLQLIADCRAAWEALDPTVVGITAVHINRFVDANGDPLPILGLGGRATQNDAAEQLAAGRVMVVDSFYRLGVDPFDSLLAHEAGHALSLEHGNGRDDDQPPDEIIDNDDDKVAGLPKFDGPNLMQYRNGTELSPGQVERARTHAFVTIPDSTIDLSGVMTEAGTIAPGLIRVLDFGFSRVLDFDIDDVQDFGLSKVLDFGFIRVLDFGLSKVLDFGFSRVLDFGFIRVLDFGMVYGTDGGTGSATLVSTTGGVLWPSPIRPDQTLLYFLDVDNDEGTGGEPAVHGFPAGGSETGIDLIVQVQISATCTEEACVDEQTATAFRFIDATTGFLEDPDAVLSSTEIRDLTIGLVVDNGGEELLLDDQKMAAIFTTQIKSGVLVEAGGRIGGPITVETLSFVDCSSALPGGESTIPIDCQCEDCLECPDYPGCTAGVGMPATVPDVLLVDTSVGLVTFDPPALPHCTVSPNVAAPGTAVTISATNFQVGEPLQVSVDGVALPFGGPTQTEFEIPADSTAARIVFEVEPAPGGPTAQVARCSVVVSIDACGDFDDDGCDDCSVAPAPGDPSGDGDDFDSDGACDAGDSDDDNDGVDDPLDPEPRNLFACGFSDADSCDDCSSGTFDLALDGVDTDGDGLCDEGDPDDDDDNVDDLADPAQNCTDLDGDGLGNGALGNVGCVHPALDRDDTDPMICADTNEDGCDDCSSGAFDPIQAAVDSDHDGLCDATDNCATVSNPHQSDYDFDGMGNECDGCTDRDGDGWGAAHYPANTCGQDNCPWIPNPGQEDQDGDEIGDPCEKATFSTAPSASLLWPPNHRMVDVTVEIVSNVPPESLSIVLLKAVSDEPDNGRGDGDTTGDIQDIELGTADLHVRLRAERTSLGQGRTYVLLYEVTNSLSGESTNVAAEIVVPLDQSGATDPLALELLQQDGATVLQWEAVTDATHYDVIRGDLANLRRLADDVDLGPVTCIANGSAETSTSDFPDAGSPLPDQAFFYLAQYHGGSDSSYGTESSPGPRIAASGACD